jgi:hypothetical protein
LVSNFAFKFNLRRYIEEFGALMRACRSAARVDALPGRGLHSSSSQLNLSRF